MANRVAVDDLRSRDVSMVCCKYYVDGLVSSMFTVYRLNRVSAMFEGSGRPDTFILAVAGARSADYLPLQSRDIDVMHTSQTPTLIAL